MKPTFPLVAVFTTLTIRLALASQTPAPVTDEFRLNQTLAGSQNDPAVAWQPGGFVAAWVDSNAGNVIGSLFSNAGALTVPEFTIRTSALDPAIATAADGRFIVTVNDDDADASGIFQHRYDPDGTPAGIGVAVNTTTAGNQIQGRVATRANGDYAIAWRSPDDDSSGVVLRFFQADGTPVTAEIPVNTTTADSQNRPEVAMAANGRVIVVWDSPQDGDGDGVTARIFDSAGAPLTAEVPVNTVTTGSQGSASVDCDAAGNFVVVWESDGQDGDGLGVYGQCFNPIGGKIGPEFRVNTTTVGNQQNSSVSVGDDGTFVVAWESPDSGGGRSIFFQRYDLLSAIKRGVEIQATASTGFFQTNPAIALGSGGRMVLAWQGLGPRIRARLYTLPAPNASTGQPIVEVRGRKKRTVTKTRISLRGTAIDNGEIAEVQLKETGKKFRTKKIKGLDAWRARVRLKPGKNRFIFRALDDEGIFSSNRRVVVTRE